MGKGSFDMKATTKQISVSEDTLRRMDAVLKHAWWFLMKGPLIEDQLATKACNKLIKELEALL
jgi:hypothetical protein